MAGCFVFAVWDSIAQTANMPWWFLDHSLDSFAFVLQLGALRNSHRVPILAANTLTASGLRHPKQTNRLLACKYSSFSRTFWRCRKGLSFKVRSQVISANQLLQRSFVISVYHDWFVFSVCGSHSIGDIRSLSRVCTRGSLVSCARWYLLRVIPGRVLLLNRVIWKWAILLDFHLAILFPILNNPDSSFVSKLSSSLWSVHRWLEPVNACSFPI